MADVCVTLALCAALIPIDKNEKLHPADLLLNRMASVDSAKFKTPRIYTIYFQTDPDFLG